jgi:hypothetical protein
MLDQLSSEDLGDLNVDRDLVTLRQLAKIARIDLDKGLRGDGFEWAIHEAVLGGEPLVTGPVFDVMRKASRYLSGTAPTSLLFGHERARHLGFLDAVIENAGDEAVLLPDGRGHPYAFGPWVAVAGGGALLYSGAIQPGDPCSGNEQGVGFTARGCRTPIAHPTSKGSPGRASPAVRPFR